MELSALYVNSFFYFYTTISQVSVGGGPTKITSTAGLFYVFGIDGSGTVSKEWQFMGGDSWEEVEASGCLSFFHWQRSTCWS